jgi:hypothetical protein
MIRAELVSPSVLRIAVPEKLKADDLRQIAPQVDSLIKQRGKIRLLIDASRFGGWENIAAFETHIGFVKNHHQKVDRIAVITAHDWQRWVVGTIKVFVHPEVRAFDEKSENDALQWIAS